MNQYASQRVQALTAFAHTTGDPTQSQRPRSNTSSLHRDFSRRLGIGPAATVREMCRISKTKLRSSTEGTPGHRGQQAHTCFQGSSANAGSGAACEQPLRRAVPTCSCYSAAMDIGPPKDIDTEELYIKEGHIRVRAVFIAFLKRSRLLPRPVDLPEICCL